MISISAFDYHKACEDFIHSALMRPFMYFQNLGELEAIMRGHGTAFWQMSPALRDECFHSRFGDWLYESKRLSCVVGWASAIDKYSTEFGQNPTQVFSKYVQEFFDYWKHDAAISQNSP